MKANECITDRVEQSTWNEAQEWEREFWLREQKNLARHGKNQAWRALALLGLMDKYRGDDDNHWWAGLFDNYSFLPTQIENAIEVGCGPYTNMRLVQRRCVPKHLFLSDPLMRTYIRFKRTFLREMYKAGACILDDHPLESLPFKDGYFDLAVMINVLDHVQDAHACMDSLVRILSPGGYVVIGQDLTDDSDLRAHPDGMRTGHPITLNESWFSSYLECFDPIIKKTLSRAEGRTPQWHYGTLAFVGVKKGLSAAK